MLTLNKFLTQGYAGDPQNTLIYELFEMSEIVVVEKAEIMELERLRVNMFGLLIKMTILFLIVCLFCLIFANQVNLICLHLITEM